PVRVLIQFGHAVEIFFGPVPPVAGQARALVFVNVAAMLFGGIPVVVREIALNLMGGSCCSPAEVGRESMDRVRHSRRPIRSSGLRSLVSGTSLNARGSRGRYSNLMSLVFYTQCMLTLLYSSRPGKFTHGRWDSGTQDPDSDIRRGVRAPACRPGD